MQALAESVCFDADRMWVALVDGRRLGVALTDFPKLLHATAKQRGQYVITGGGTSLHWDDLDEDIAVHALVLGDGERRKRADRARPPERKARRRKADKRKSGKRRYTRR
jgi:hypothetical protein